MILSMVRVLSPYLSAIVVIRGCFSLYRRVRELVILARFLVRFLVDRCHGFLLFVVVWCSCLVNFLHFWAVSLFFVAFVSGLVFVAVSC